MHVPLQRYVKYTITLVSAYAMEEITATMHEQLEIVTVVNFSSDYWILRLKVHSKAAIELINTVCSTQ